MPESHLHEVGKLQQAFQLLLDSPAFFAFFVSTLFAWAVFWMRHIFVTRGALRELETKNSKEHVNLGNEINTIAEDVAWIKGYLQRYDHD